jgi:hypothetical protein
MQSGMKAAAGVVVMLSLMVLMGLVGLSVSELAPLNIHIQAGSPPLRCATFLSSMYPI